MARMNERRLLFVDTPRPATLMPVYLAFVAIAMLALLGFALAYWMRGPALSDYQPVREEAVPSRLGHEAGVLIAPRVRDLPGRTRSM
jgi:hypothetical protein